MKRLLSIGLLAGLFITGAADAGEWSVGVRAGWAVGDSGTGDLNADLAAKGLNATASSSDDTRGAWLLSLGYDYTPEWGVEMAYVDLGEVTTTFTGTAADVDAFMVSGDDIHPNTAQGWQLAGVYRYALDSVTPLYAKARLGAFAWTSEYTLHGVTSTRDVDESGTDVTFGLGLEMDMNSLEWMPRGYSGSVNWDRYDIDGEPIDLWTLGLNYHF